MQSFISQMFGIVSPFGENLDVFVPQDLKLKVISITKPQNSSSTQSEL